MGLKREMLVEAGIEDKSVIDNIMQAYGAGIENAKSQVKSELQAENETLKQQLEQQTQAINDLQAKEGASAESKQFSDIHRFTFNAIISENRCSSL